MRAENVSIPIAYCSSASSLTCIKKIVQIAGSFSQYFSRTGKRKAADPRGRRLVVGLDPECLPLDLVNAIAGFGLRGLDLEPVLLCGGREETAYAVGLPIRGLHDL